MAWLVQARFTVEGEPRSGQPVIVPTKWQANRTAADMYRSLAHFHSVDVLVRLATDEDEARDLEHQRVVATRPLSIVHLADSAEAARTACGESVEGLAAVVFDADLLPDDRACPLCEAVSPQR